MGAREDWEERSDEADGRCCLHSKQDDIELPSQFVAINEKVRLNSEATD